MYDIKKCAHGHAWCGSGACRCLHAGACTSCSHFDMQAPARAARTSTLRSVYASGNRELDCGISKAPVSADTIYCRKSPGRFHYSSLNLWLRRPCAQNIPRARKTAARMSLGHGERARSWMGGWAAC